MSDDAQRTRLDARRRGNFRRRRTALLLTSISIAGAGVGAALVLTGSSGARATLDATTLFSVFRDTPAASAPVDLTSARSLSAKADFARTHELGRGLGQFGSHLFIFPANGNRNVCYALLGSAPEDPAMAYCYTPNDATAAPVAGEHFDVSALQSLTDGKIGVQLFGVAFDDVVRVRVQVAGQWRPIPVVHNGFYLDLPGVSYTQLGNLEATLKAGTVQVHDIQHDTRVS